MLEKKKEPLMLNTLIMFISLLSFAQASNITTGNYGNDREQCGVKVEMINNNLSFTMINNPISGFKCNENTMNIPFTCNNNICESAPMTASTNLLGTLFEVDIKREIKFKTENNKQLLGLKTNLYQCRGKELDCGIALSNFQTRDGQFSFNDIRDEVPQSLFISNWYRNRGTCEETKARAFYTAYNECKEYGYKTCTEVYTKNDHDCKNVTSAFKGTN